MLTEYAQGPGRGSETVELLGRHTRLVIGPAKIGNQGVPLVADFLTNRLPHARFDLDARIVEQHLPFVRDGQDDVAADELRPVQVIAVSR